MRRLWFYAPQRVAVEHWLGGLLPRNNFCSVDARTLDHLCGLEDEVFVRIANHPATVPQILWDRLAERGFTIITIDDSNNRRRRENWHGRH